MEATTLSGSHFFQWKPFVLLEAIRFSGKRSYYSKLLLLVEAIIFSGNHWPVVVFIPFSEKYSF